MIRNVGTVKGISLRKYGPVIKALTTIFEDSSVPAETKLEAAKELASIYRRADNARQRELSREFKWKCLVATKAVTDKETAKKGKEQPTSKPSVDLSAVEAMYAAARANGKGQTAAQTAPKPGSSEYERLKAEKLRRESES
jgi:hypothetical protein